MSYNAKKHWENIFHTKSFNELSRHQENPKTPVELILSTNLNKDAYIIKGGNSNLVDKLLELGFKKE